MIGAPVFLFRHNYTARAERVKRMVAEFRISLAGGHQVHHRPRVLRYVKKTTSIHESLRYRFMKDVIVALKALPAGVMRVQNQ
jgi:hypothetical protein